MEIAISKKGALRVLSAKGNLRLQQWRVIGKHLDVLLAQGASWVVMDLREATLISGAGVSCLALNARKFGERQAHLLLLTASPDLQAALRAADRESLLTGNLCADWDAVEERLRARGFAASVH